MGVIFVTRKTSQYGFGQRGTRQYARPEDIEYETLDPDRFTLPEISIESVSGAFSGVIRGDYQKSLLKEISFVIDEHGCVDFEFKLNGLPNFEILPYSIISFNIGNALEPQYKGLLTQPDDINTDKDEYVFRGYGLRQYLQELKAFDTYSSGDDISDVVNQIASTWISPYCPIEYRPAKIEGPVGVVLVNDIEVGKYSIQTVLDILAQAAQTDSYYYTWGVDGMGQFYWTKVLKTTVIQDNYVGYSMHKYESNYDYTNIKNVITLTRKNSIATGGSGWSVAGTYSDSSSIAKYGRKEITVQLPGYFTGSDADLVGNAMLQDLKDPKLKAICGGFVANTKESFLGLGLHRFIVHGKKFNQLVSEWWDFESNSGYTHTGGSGLSIANDTTYFITGDQSLKFSYITALNEKIRYDTEITSQAGQLTSIRFYIRSDYMGSFLEAGIQDNDNPGVDLVSLTVDIPIKNKFILIDLDVSGVTNAEKEYLFFFKITQNISSPGVNFWIDKLDAVYEGKKTHKLLFKRAKYEYKNTGADVNAEYGSITKSLPQYVAALQKLSDDLLYTSEES